MTTLFYSNLFLIPAPISKYFISPKDSYTDKREMTAPFLKIWTSVQQICSAVLQFLPHGKLFPTENSPSLCPPPHDVPVRACPLAGALSSAALKYKISTSWKMGHRLTTYHMPCISHTSHSLQFHVLGIYPNLRKEETGSRKNKEVK